ncbi:DUF6624 domain-containing protein [Brevundimonas sp. G8]|uniref:DUF6624 domain-containing protein n=1 Tax=Brevundimonas sp. G8 TaxID=1350776 RepID=UPI0012EF5F9A|nr:DUF6624 domain-containing protein [Brevundimonas sp. G8]VXB03694.1 conserved exported hypothetical protein [Brevundimonas sp. G8]
MLAWFLVAALGLTDLSPAAEAALRPLTEAIATARAKQAALPENPIPRERLELALTLDQEPLKAMHSVDLSALSETDRLAAQAEAKARVDAISDETVATVLSLVPPEGWFSNVAYGQDAATGAFLVIQHADTALQKRFLPALEAMAERGEALKWQYAMMYDRIAVAENRTQRYGTQMQCVAGRMVPSPTEDPERLEQRRAPMGFRWPDYAAYLANFGAC